MRRRVLAAAALLGGGVVLAGCSLLSDFGDSQFAAEASDGGSADGGGAGGGGGADAGDAGGGGACSVDADCRDQDACDGDEVCGDDGRCENGTPFECDPSNDPCRDSICVSAAGEAHCELRDANEGDTCAMDDDTSQAADQCARDYVCARGACTPETVETCTPGQCRLRAGCAPNSGCRYVARPATRDCDDDDPCTVGDKCSGTDASCAGTPKDCADAIGCTDDACDGGNCVHTANDTNCEESCRTGLCDAVMDCGNWTNDVDFTNCNDGASATSPDFCYAGACVGGAKSAPSASCAVGGCSCSSWTSPKDLEYVNGTYVGLIDATHSGGGGGCTSGTVSIVYDVTPEALTHYTTDTAGGAAVASPGADITSTYVVSASEVGVLDTGGRDVQWINTALDSSLASGTPLIVNFQGISFHGEGPFLGGTTHAWVWGDDSGTATSSRLVRCSWSPCVFQPCAEPAPVCTYENLWTTSTFTGVTAYTQAGMVATRTYVGVIASLNVDNGPPTKYVQEEGVTLDYTLAANERSDMDGVWNGTLARGNGLILVFGSGAVNLTQCDDSAYDGDATCAAITGLPNQASRSYYDATQTVGGGVAMLATSCMPGAICLSAAYYLTVCASGADPTVGSNWREYQIGNYAFMGNSRVPSEIAAGGNSTDGYSITVLGEDEGVPYVWQWAPEP